MSFSLSRFLESLFTNSVHHSNIRFDTTSSASAPLHSHGSRIPSEFYYTGQFSPFDDDFEENPAQEPETHYGSSFPTNSLLLAGTVFENPRPAPKPNEAAMSGDDDQRVELSRSPALQLLREIDTWEATTEMTGSSAAPTTETDDAQTEVDFPSWEFPSSVGDSLSDRSVATTPTPRSPQPRTLHQFQTELSPEFKLNQLLFGSILVHDGQDAISPKTKTLGVFSDTVTNIYANREKLSSSGTNRMYSLQPLERQKLDDEQPNFTNPWDGNKCIESRRTDSGVVYSTESAWRKRTARTTRNYFGSDDDEIYIPPHFSFPRGW